jgi:ribosome-binding factor A
MVSSLIKKTLGEIISKDVSDPKAGLVTITDVEVSPDLKFAKVYYTVIGKNMEKQKNKIATWGKFLRQRLSQRIMLKYIPKLIMVYDETPMKAQRVETLLKKIRQEHEA